MIADIDKYIDYLTTHNLTEHQFLILWLVHTKDNTNIIKYKRAFSQFNIDQLLDLIERGWIDDFGTIKNNKQEFNIYNYIVTNKFSDTIIIDEEDAYINLCKVYPKFISVKGIKWPTIKGDPAKIAASYFKYHKGNKLSTDRVEKITEKYYANHPVTGNIEDYILNRRWNLLEEDLVGGVNDSFKTI